MKKLLQFLIFVPLIVGGCAYDDGDLRDRVDDLDSRLKEVESLVNRLNSEVSAIKALVGSTGATIAIIDVTETSSGYVITFSDGNSISLRHGSGTAAADIPLVGIKKGSDGVYYWTMTIAGSTDWLLDDQGRQIPVAGEKGADGVQGPGGDRGLTPVMGVDAYGFWTVDYGDGQGPGRVLDAGGNAVKAGGDAGDSLFERIDATDGNFVVFYLSNGEIVVVPRTDARFGFVEKSTAYIVAGTTVELEMELKNIAYGQLAGVPEGWSAYIDLDRAVAVVTAPADGEGSQAGMVAFMALDDNSNVLWAGILVESYQDRGYADPGGTFIVVEGNMTTENGTLVWFDSDMNMHERVFEEANGGLEIGNVVQDMYIANDRIYLLTQNGSSKGGAGRFVVCDARTMEMEYALPLVFTTDNSVACWPQHLVVVSPSKAYIQWSDSAMENTSGIRVMDLAGRTISQGDIPGTCGQFTTTGATKGRMVFSRGKLFAGTGHSVSIINTETDLIDKKIEFGCQVKGIVKGADGNIYVALAQEYSGAGPNTPGTFLGNTRIVGLDHNGGIVHDNYLPSDVIFPVSTFSPKIQLAASFNEPYLYFTDKNEFYFSSLGRYNYSDGTMTREFIRTNDIYGYVGQHPVTGQLWMCSSSTMHSTSVQVKVYDTDSREQVRDYTIQKGFSAGVDFGYRFTDEFVNR